MATETINSEAELRAAILRLESTQAVEEKILREQFHLTYESMKPINLIKSTVKEAAASEDIKDNLLNISVGLAVGYVSKKLFEGASHSPLRRLVGTVLQFGIANVVAKNPDAVKTVAKGVFKVISSGVQRTNAQLNKTK